MNVCADITTAFLVAGVGLVSSGDSQNSCCAEKIILHFLHFASAAEYDFCESPLQCVVQSGWRGEANKYQRNTRFVAIVLRRWRSRRVQGMTFVRSGSSILVATRNVTLLRSRTVSHSLRCPMAGRPETAPQTRLLGSRKRDTQEAATSQMVRC